MQVLVLALALLPLSLGFVASPSRWTGARNVAVEAEASASRREVLGRGLGLAGLVAAGGLGGGVAPASAGYLNADSLPEVLAPDAAAVDRDILKSAKVQDALKEVQFFQSVIAEMKKGLEANPQLDVGPGIRKYLPFDKIRTALNTVNSALDEETQRGTDRLVRNVIQDITELENANKLKEGISRSDRKVGIMVGKLSKLEAAFSDFLAFFN